jgi:2-Cys peroxiredoxin 5
MSFDGTALLGGHRSLRYAALVENGTVSKIFVEDAPTDLEKTRAENVLAAL